MAVEYVRTLKHLSLTIKSKSRQSGGWLRKGSAEGKTKGRGRNAGFYCGFLFLPLPLGFPFAYRGDIIILYGVYYILLLNRKSCFPAKKASRKMPVKATPHKARLTALCGVAFIYLLRPSLPLFICSLASESISFIRFCWFTRDEPAS